MNKNARKLIPAVAMLLVSASMLSTASYAWFSMNNKVTANGMKVDIVAPGSIEISNTIESNEVKFTSGNAQVTINKYDSAVTEGESIANLAAVSSVDGNKLQNLQKLKLQEMLLARQSKNIILPILRILLLLTNIMGLRLWRMPIILSM